MSYFDEEAFFDVEDLDNTKNKEHLTMIGICRRCETAAIIEWEPGEVTPLEAAKQVFEAVKMHKTKCGGDLGIRDAANKRTDYI